MEQETGWVDMNSMFVRQQMVKDIINELCEATDYGLVQFRDLRKPIEDRFRLAGGKISHKEISRIIRGLGFVIDYRPYAHIVGMSFRDDCMTVGSNHDDSGSEINQVLDHSIADFFQGHVVHDHEFRLSNRRLFAAWHYFAFKDGDERGMRGSVTRTRFGRRWNLMLDPGIGQPFRTLSTGVMWYHGYALASDVQVMNNAIERGMSRERGIELLNRLKEPVEVQEMKVRETLGIRLSRKEKERIGFENAHVLSFLRDAGIMNRWRTMKFSELIQMYDHWRHLGPGELAPLSDNAMKETLQRLYGSVFD